SRTRPGLLTMPTDNTHHRHWKPILLAGAAWLLATAAGAQAQAAPRSVVAAVAPAASHSSQAGSTRALRVSELASGLDHPWSLAFLPGKEGILIRERRGAVLLWRPDTGLQSPISGVPK